MGKAPNGKTVDRDRSNLSKEDIERVLDAGKLLFSVLSDVELEKLEEEILLLSNSLNSENGKHGMGNTGVA